MKFASLIACLFLSVLNLSSQWFVQPQFNSMFGGYDINFVSSTTGFFCGQTGIYKTMDGAQTWNQLNVGNFNLNNANYFQIKFSSASDGCAVGYSVFQGQAVAAVTNNGGASWNATWLGNSNSTLEGLDFPSTNVGYVCGFNGECWKTSNGGNSWSQLPAFTSSDLVAIEFTTDDTGMIGGAGVLYRTTDGGTSWNSIPGPWGTITVIQFVNSQDGYLICGGVVYETQDGGLTWTVNNSSIAFRDLCFINEDTGYAVAQSGIFKTIDGCGYWSAQQYDTAYSLFTCIDMLNSTEGFIGGFSGTVLHTGNGGGNSYFPFNDASITSPPVLSCYGSQGITVTLHNSGVNTISSCWVKWIVDGIPQLPYYWSGTLAPGDSVSPLLVGQYNFSLGNHTVKVYSDSANGNSDTRVNNDTITFSFTANACTTNDAGVIAATAPAGFVGSPGVQTFSVNVKNFGANQLSNFIINWEFNGIPQASFYWNGNLQGGLTTTSLALGNVNITGGTNIIKCWTLLPNAINDIYNSNDTLYYSVYCCSGPMIGTYNIGGGITRDFNSFTDAVMALDSCGINGSVDISAASGVYYEKLTIPQIAGTSATNKITFSSISGDSTTVVLKFGTNSNNIQGNYTLKLNGADYCTFRNMTFATDDSLSYSLVTFDNNSQHITFKNCQFIGKLHPYNQLNIQRYLLSSTSVSSIDDSTVITNNLFKFGRTAIHMSGGTFSIVEAGITITNNVIDSSSYRGIDISQTNRVRIIGNTIRLYALDNTSQSANPAYGIKVSGEDSTLISGNDISINSPGGSRGISLVGGNSMYVIASNNFIKLNSETGNWSYGIYVDALTALLYHNTIWITGSATNSSCIKTGSTNQTGIVVYNSVLYNTNGYCYDRAGGSTWQGDYNCLYTSGTYAIVPFAYPTWTSYQILEPNSVSAIPLFVSSSDLHIQYWCSDLDGSGTPLPSVSDDIDGETRNPLTPDIGADEYVSLFTTNNISSNQSSWMKIMPNPVTTTSTLSYWIAEEDHIYIKLYDLLGHEISVLENGAVSAGEHLISFNREMLGLSPGIYFCTLQSTGNIQCMSIIVE